MTTDFDSARAWDHLEALVAFGPRPPGSPAAAQVREYLRTAFTATGATVRDQEFTAHTPHGQVPMTNLWAEVAGAHDGILVIGAHYDTKRLAGVADFVGANDSASAVAVLLTLAEALAQGPPPPRTVWLVCFDGEEAYGPWSETDGIYGSRAFVAHLREDQALRRIVGMINLDMIGDEHLRILREAQSTPWLVDRIWAAATARGLQRHFGSEQQAVTDDHVPFLRAGIPAVNLIDFRYGPRSLDNRWWHSRHDTVAHCRPSSLGVVGDVVLTVLRGWETPPD